MFQTYVKFIKKKVRKLKIMLRKQQGKVGKLNRKLFFYKYMKILIKQCKKNFGFSWWNWWRGKVFPYEILKRWKVAQLSEEGNEKVSSEISLISKWHLIWVIIGNYEHSMALRGKNFKFENFPWARNLCLRWWWFMLREVIKNKERETQLVCSISWNLL